MVDESFHRCLNGFITSKVLFFSIDATNSQTLGKFVNDSSYPNAKMRIEWMEDGLPHLLLFALVDIPPYTEIRFNYGAPGLWWRKKFPKFNKPFNLKVTFSCMSYSMYIRCVQGGEGGEEERG